VGRETGKRALVEGILNSSLEGCGGEMVFWFLGKPYCDGHERAGGGTQLGTRGKMSWVRVSLSSQRKKEYEQLLNQNAICCH